MGREAGALLAGPTEFALIKILSGRLTIVRASWIGAICIGRAISKVSPLTASVMSLGSRQSPIRMLRRQSKRGKMGSVDMCKNGLISRLRELVYFVCSSKEKSVNDIGK